MKLADMLTDAANVAHQNPDDPAQGKCQIVLTTGERITGRLESADPEDDYAIFAEHEHDTLARSDPDAANFPRFVRVDHVISFQYI